MCVETLERDRLEEPGGHDPIGVDVLAAQRQRASFHGLNMLRAHYRTPAGTCSRSWRRWCASPVIAAPATIAGLMRSVLPVGLPCRPLKFLFEEAAQT